MESVVVYRHEKDELLDYALKRYNSDGELILDINNIGISKDDYKYLEETNFKKKVIGTLEHINRRYYYRR